MEGFMKAKVREALNEFQLADVARIDRSSEETIVVFIPKSERIAQVIELLKERLRSLAKDFLHHHDDQGEFLILSFN